MDGGAAAALPGDGAEEGAPREDAAAQNHRKDAETAASKYLDTSATNWEESERLDRTVLTT